MTPKDLEPFHTFSWLMAVEMKAIVNQASDALFDFSSAVPVPGFEGSSGLHRDRDVKSATR